MFGTFVPEEAQRDYYGLAQPLQTFDAVAANAEHWSRMRDIGASRSSRFGRCAALLRRRVAQRWVFNPAGLFKPFPPTKRSLWVLPTAPERTKYDGDAAPYALTIYIACHAVLALAAGVYALIFAPSLPLGPALAIIAGVMASASVIGGLLDHPWRVGTESVRVAALTALCIWAPQSWIECVFPSALLGLLTPDTLVMLRSCLVTVLVGGWWLALRLSPCTLPPQPQPQQQSAPAFTSAAAGVAAAGASPFRGDGTAVPPQAGGVEETPSGSTGRRASSRPSPSPVAPRRRPSVAGPGKRLRL
jgi:hypothetical protein